MRSRDSGCKDVFHSKFVRPGQQTIVSVDQAERPGLFTRVHSGPTLKILHRLLGKATHVGKIEVLRRMTSIGLHVDGHRMENFASIRHSSIGGVRDAVRARGRGAGHRNSPTDVRRAYPPSLTLGEQWLNRSSQALGVRGIRPKPSQPARPVEPVGWSTARKNIICAISNI